MTYALDEDWEQDYDRMVYASLIEPQRCTSIVASNFTLLTLTRSYECSSSSVRAIASLHSKHCTTGLDFVQLTCSFRSCWDQHSCAGEKGAHKLLSCTYTPQTAVIFDTQNGGIVSGFSFTVRFTFGSLKRIRLPACIIDLSELAKCFAVLVLHKLQFSLLLKMVV